MSDNKQIESIGLVVEKLKTMPEKDQMTIISSILKDGVHLTQEVLDILQKHFNPAFFDGDAVTTKVPQLFKDARIGLRVYKDYLIYGTKSETIKVINLVTKTLEVEFETHGKIVDFVIYENRDQIYVTRDNGWCYVYSITSKSYINEFRTDAKKLAINDHILYAVGGSHKVRRWDLDAGEQLTDLEMSSPSEIINVYAYNDSVLITTEYYIYDITKRTMVIGRALNSIITDMTNNNEFMLYSKDTGEIYYRNPKNNWTDGSSLHLSKPVYAIHADRNILYIGIESGIITAYNFRTKEKIQDIANHNSKVTNLIQYKDQLISSHEDGSIHFHKMLPQHTV